MALAPLAGTEDLEARGIVVDEDAAEVLLAAASDAVRAEAGSAISRHTSTVRFVTEASRRLELPARPVVSVDSVLLDGVPVTDWVLRGSSLWRSCRWHSPGGVPSEVTVTFTHGYEDVPGVVVDLVCALVAAGASAMGDGYDPKRRMSYERIDDYQYGLRTGEDEIVSVMELPKRTAAMLRRRFGGGSLVAGTVR